MYPNEFLDSRRTADLEMTESDRMAAGFLVVNSKRKGRVRGPRNVVDSSGSSSNFRRNGDINSTSETKTRTSRDIFRKLENNTYDESVLWRIGYRDRYDEALYAHAKALFERRAEMYDLEDCMRLARWTRAALTNA